MRKSSNSQKGLSRNSIDEEQNPAIYLNIPLPQNMLTGSQTPLEHSTYRSCCILIARTTLRQGDTWYTHIDYPRFFQLLESGEPFTPLDYIAETPEWAYFGNGGFNPEDVRVKRNKKADKEKEEKALRAEIEQIGGRVGKVIEGEDIDVVLDGGCGG